MRIPIIDPFLNKITMYRLTLYYLILLVFTAFILSLFKLVPYSSFDILISTLVTIISCLAFNLFYSKFFKASTNIESVFITALILILIIPVKFPSNLSFLMLASLLAMASKYLVTIEKIHIFNPAAVSVVAISLLSAEHSAVWWVGTMPMLPSVVIGGLILLRKIERGDMIFNFVLTYLLLIAIPPFIRDTSIASILNALETAVFRSPLFFFSFVMLTEPLTSPSKNFQGRIYSSIVALLYATPQLRLFGFAFTPEMSLCIGNVYSYIVNPKYKFFLKLKNKVKISPDIYLFNFGKISNFNFRPGQYLEWTLPHKNTDSRGNRRYFSIASAPSEDLMIMVKFYDNSSSYKQALLEVNDEQQIIASSLSGEFTLPKKESTPIVFIAGGVGISPFRSIIQNIVDRQERVNIVLLFANRRKEDIIFKNLFDKAKELGVNTIYTLTDTQSIPADWTGEVGRITPSMIQKIIPDYRTRMFYISGPTPMVKAYQEVLRELRINSKDIVVDYFPGYEE